MTNAAEQTAGERLDGGGAVVKWLKGAGVRHVFSVSGGPINPVYRACKEQNLQLVHARHEAAACYMAEAAFRVTGAAGAAVVTLGPGVTNTVTPAIVSHLGGTPLIIIGAQASTANADRGAGMAYEVLPAMRAVTKWAGRCTDPARLPEYLDIAWRKMWAGRPGPVFLEVPTDVLHAAVAAPARTSAPPPRPAAPGLDAGDLAAFLAVFSHARRPILLVGDDTFVSGPGRLQEAIERHRLPFFTLRLARGIVDERHALWAGPGYAPCNGALRRALREADTIILLGHHFEFDLDFGNSVGAGARVVQVAADQELLHRNRRADVAINTAAPRFADALADTPVGEKDDAWRDALIAEWRAERDGQAGADSTEGLHPITAIDTVADSAPENTIFISSHGNVDFWADARLRVNAPGRYLRAGQAGALGAEVPYGAGASFAAPDAPVVVFVGDGGVGFHIAELDTAERYGRAFIIVVLDDELWGAIALPQERSYGETFEMRLPRRDWARVAEGLGGKGYHARTPAEIATALADAIASGKPAIVQVPVRSVLSPYMAYIS
ncbi:thiamine pyrophosphate-binding protein [Pseudochelatococcus sp. B33]